MAVERLILRGVLWGADKVPDRWFEKVPGGFFIHEDGKKKYRESNPKTTRNSANTGGSTSVRDRRHSASDDSRTNRDSRRDGGYRSDGQPRRSARGDRSMDGGADEDTKGQDCHRPVRDQVIHDGRPRSFDGNRVASGREHSNAQRGSQARSDARATSNTNSRDSRGRASRTEAAERAGKAASPMTSLPYPTSPTSPQQSALLLPSEQRATQAAPFVPSGHQQRQTMTAPRRANLGDSYIPYAHIYGAQPTSPTYTAPPPQSSNAFSPPVMPKPDHYQQNPYAQIAPTAADAGAGAAYTGQNAGGYYGASIPDPWSGRGPSENDSEYPQQHPIPQSPSPARNPHNSQQYGKSGGGGGISGESSSVGSNSSNNNDREHNDRPARDELARRRDDDYTTNNGKSRPKSKSRIREAFDMSDRGLGYGAVGALAGGLVGSEVGRGSRIWPMAVGATVGALGANAFEARERRKELSRHEQFIRDGTYDRAAGKHRDE